MTAHAVQTSIVGAGTGDTYYLASCLCGWRHEDYSAMSTYDRAVTHESQAVR